MQPVRFEAIVGEDHVIRLPDGVELPAGPVEVTVRAVAESDPASQSESLEETRRWLLQAAADVEQADPQLPSDLASRHDHYAHGKPGS
ncbi:MAG: hypothetical protein IID44_12355 [Planctomycetes bacterium]|nr:hypothetical protein [Planctomycetota bacterium]